MPTKRPVGPTMLIHNKKSDELEAARQNVLDAIKLAHIKYNESCRDIESRYERMITAFQKRIEEVCWRDSGVLEEMVKSLPLGPEVRFKQEVLDFDSLVKRLVVLEEKHGFSSLELFRQYIRGEWKDEKDLDEWVSLLILFMGTKEVRQFACPTEMNFVPVHSKRLW